MDTSKRLVTWMCVWLLLGQLRDASHVPANMNQTIKSLLHHYKVAEDDISDGQPVFNRSHLSFKKEEVKKAFMGGILETYHKLFKKMLEQQPTASPATSAGANAKADGSSVRGGLKYLLKMVDLLKKNHYQEQEELIHRLDSLHHIQTDAVVVQNKALWELPRLYEEASALANDKRRRRRQTQRSKKRPRAGRK